MKRLLIVFIIASTFAVAIGLLAYYVGPGYVVFSFADYSIETSFIFMLGMLVIAFFLFYYLLRMLSVFVHLPNYLGFRYSSRQSEKARNALVRGLIEMSEGRFAQAEKILLKQAIHSDTGLLNYLMAARSAQQLGAYDRRDEYLRLAHESTPSADIAIGITQAELQLAHKQYEQALATLNHLVTVAPKHGYVKKLQARVYQNLGDWDNLANLLDQVRKQKLISADKLADIETETYIGQLNNQIKLNSYEALHNTWQQIPKHQKNNYQLVSKYANYLIKLARDNEAEVLLRGFLSRHWQESLVLLYSRLKTDNAERQLESAETWLHGHSRSAALLLVLGKLCIRAKLWGKGRSYLESSLGIKPMSETYFLLAQLLEQQMNEVEKAQKFYKMGLQLAIEESTEQADTSATTGSLQSADYGINTPVLRVIQ
ncbi:MAG: heme biosynthesis protein HemY [Gammaproteobacteria bacterium]|nr:heme biosynthesis protein HemY [Gammaproteobacteria bacterium]